VKVTFCVLVIIFLFRTSTGTAK